MLRFDQGNIRFNFRSVAVIIHSEHLLIHRAIDDDFWALPGGRVEFFETSDATVIRELHEELGLQARIDRHLWYIENFFNLKQKQFHEVANYFLTSFVTPPVINSEADFAGIEQNVQLVFRWVPLNKLSQYTLKPEFLLSGIHALPASTQYIKLNER